MARMAIVPMPPVDHTATRTGRVGMWASRIRNVASANVVARRRQNVRCIVPLSRRGRTDRSEGELVGERLEGKVCIVTGAAQGIGAAYARALAREGADVAIIDLKRIDQAGPVQDDIEALGRRALVIEADVSDAEQMAAMGKQVVDTFGHVDCTREQRRADVRPAHRDVGRLPRGELHGRDQRVERGGALLLGAAQRLDREHLVERRVPAVAADAHEHPRGCAGADARARGLRHDEVDDPPSDQDDGAAARVTEHPRERGVPGRDHVGRDQGGRARRDRRLSWWRRRR